MKNLLRLFFVTIVILGAAVPVFATHSSWDDLDEGEYELFGSEKAKKVQIDGGPFFRKEDWPDGSHSVCMFLQLYKSTDFPKYTSTRFLPFFYHMDSKIDNRERSLYLLLWYNHIDDTENLTVSPFYYSRIDKKEQHRSFLWFTWWGHHSYKYRMDKYLTIFPLLYWNNDYTNENQFEFTIVSPLVYWHTERKDSKDGYTQERANLSLLHMYYSDYTASGDLRERVWWFPIIPLVLRSWSHAGGHQNILWLIDWDWDTVDGKDRLNHFWFFPVFLHKPGDDGYTDVLPPVFINLRKSNGELYTHLLPLYQHTKSVESTWDYDRDTGVTGYYESYLTPIYSSFTTSSGENKWDGDILKKTFFFPLVPLYYSSYDQREGTHRNLAWLFDWQNRRDGTNERFWFTPLYFQKDDSYLHIPPLGYLSWWDNFEKYIVAPYLYKYSYKAGAQAEVSEERIWVPILPLLYSSYQSPNGGVSRNLLMLFDWRYSKEGVLDRLWIAPFYFAKDNAYRHIPPLLYMSWTEGRTTMRVNPLFYWETVAPGTPEPAKRDGETGDSITTAVTGAGGSSRLWVPILPVLYSHHYREDGSVSRNALILFDWHTTKEGNTDRFWAMPFVFQKDGAYLHLLPPLFMSWDDANSSLKLSIFGMDYREAPFDKDHAGFERFWFPVIPLVYSSRTEETGVKDKNLLVLFDWQTNPDGSWKSFWAFPLVFHEFGSMGYRVYAPFYFRPSGNTDERGWSFGLFYYHNWSPGYETQWALLYYKHYNQSTGFSTSNLVPLYWNFETKKREFTLVLPLYLDYSDRKTKVHVNILGLSKSSALGAYPNVSLGLGSNESNYYVDLDLSWLYDAVSLSYRSPIPFTEKAMDEATRLDLEREAKAKAEAQPKGVSLASKSTVSRDDSNNFFGFKFLYGWLAWQRADARTHFRLLPLSWITFTDTDSVKVILNYISYDSKELEYLVFFPFYGMQRVDRSYKKAYLLNLYWTEYDQTEDLYDRSVVWPIINWYNGAKKSGWRILPLFYHWERQKKDERVAKSLFLPLYYSSRTTDADKNVNASFTISPLWYYDYKQAASYEEKTWWFPILPLVYYNRDETRYAANIGERKEGSYPLSTASSFVLPLWFWTSRDTLLAKEGATRTDFTLLGLPLLYYSSARVGDETRERSLFMLGYYYTRDASIAHWSFLLGLVGSTDYKESGASEFELLWGLYKSYSSNEKNKSHFLPFYYYERAADKSEFLFMLGLYQGIWHAGKDDSENSFLFWLVHTEVSHAKRSAYINGNYATYDARERATWVVPALYYYSSATSETPGYEYFENSHTSLFFYKDYRTDKDHGYESTFWFPIIPLVYRSSSGDGSHLNVLGLFDWSNDHAKQAYRRWLIPVLPIWYTYSSPDESTWFFLPPLLYRSHDRTSDSALTLLWYSSNDRTTGESSRHLLPFVFSWREKEASTLFTLPGFYLHSSPGYSHWNLLLLVDRSRQEDKDYTSTHTGFVLNTISWDFSPSVTEFNLVWGALLSYKNYKTSPTDWSTNVLWFLYQVGNEQGRFYHYATPLWYYSRDAQGYSLLIPPLLSYLSSDKDYGKFQMWALGALWYRNYKPQERSDTQTLLLGIPYYKVQVPERGYTGRGSLWGILWEYQTESETGFSKFSILKILYQRVTIDGETYNRVLGIKF
ncbi:MAG: hypothetical protein EPN93_12040 [Spirochaetes bacterium]|nr:MAG: hypothetical protein EPN93_12040 [Spirochaetota bacterium]